MRPCRRRFVEKAWRRRLPGAICVVLSTINSILFLKPSTIDCSISNKTNYPLTIQLLATPATTMDVQSLESRFEGISVNDENHDQNSHKSKVSCRQQQYTTRQETLLTSDTGININLQLGHRRRSQPTKASVAEAARQCHKELAVLCQRRKHCRYNRQNYPSLPGSTKILRYRATPLRPPVCAILHPSTTLDTQTVPPRHV
jgi:hypothetical protein